MTSFSNCTAGTILPIIVIDCSNPTNVVPVFDGFTFIEVHGAYFDDSNTNDPTKCIYNPKDDCGNAYLAEYRYPGADSSFCSNVTNLHQENSFNCLSDDACAGWTCDKKPAKYDTGLCLPPSPTKYNILAVYHSVITGNFCYNEGMDCFRTCTGTGLSADDIKFNNTKTTQAITGSQNNPEIGKCVIYYDRDPDYKSFALSPDNDGKGDGKTISFTSSSNTLAGPGSGWALIINSSNPSPDTFTNGFARMQFNLFNTFTLDTFGLPIITSLQNMYQQLVFIQQTNLPQTCKDYLIYSSYIYATTCLFYNSIYQSQLLPPNNNIYLNTHCLNLNFVSNFMRSNSLLPNYTLPTFVNFPTVSQDSNGFYITFSLSFQQIQQFIACTPDGIDKHNSRISYMTAIANGFLRDSDGQYETKTGDLPLPVFSLYPDNIYNNKNLDIFGLYQYTYIDDYKTLTKGIPFFIVRKGIDPTNPSQLQQIISFDITLKIEQWSLMLLAYFICASKQTSNPPFVPTFSNDLIKTFSINLGTIPFKLPNTLDDLKSNCNVGFATKQNIFPDNHTLGQYVYTYDSDDCICYVSQLAPRGSAPGQKAAICFDINCDTGAPHNPSDVRSLMGLSNDRTCVSECEQMNDWEAVASFASNAGSLNDDRFKKLCPTYKTENYNKDVLILGSFFTILISAFTFLVCKNKKYGNFSVFITTSIIFCILGYLTYYLCNFLLGIYVCKQDNLGKPYCISKKLYLPENKETPSKTVYIPDAFCDGITNKPNCKCIQNADCNNNEICISSTCYPIGVDPVFDTLSAYKINYFTLVSALLISILFPLLFVYASEDYDWHLQKKTSIAIVLLISTAPLIYFVVKTLKPVQEKIMR
jgi:hypothetical protein